MKILIMGNRIVAEAENISFGIYDEPIEKWRIADAEDKVMYYILDNGFELVEDVTLPDDYRSGKYFYENGEFILNEEWKAYVSLEEKIAEMEKKLAEMDTDAVWDEMAVAIEEGVNEV